MIPVVSFTALISLLGTGTAHAQAAIELPDVDASSPPAVIDGQHALLVPDAGSHAATHDGATDTFIVRADVQRVQSPLVLIEQDGDPRNVITSVWRLDLGAAWNSKRLQINGTAPLILRYDGADIDGDHTLGDPRLGTRLALLEGEDRSVGLALQAGLQAPLGAWSVSQGQHGFSGDLGVITDLSTGPLWLGAVAGVVFGPAQTASGVATDDALDLRLAASVDIATRTRLGVEARTRTDLSAPWTSTSNSPAELLISGHHQTPGGMRLRAGVGLGLSSGLGTPAWRMLVGIGHAG